MQRVIEEMAKAKSDVEKRYREKIPEIIRECMAFAYLGKSFTFDANADLENRVNQRLIELSDEILEDIEKRAKKAIQYAEDEDDEDSVLAYMKREQNGEDLISRIDKHSSNLRYFLEGWIALGIVNDISQSSLMSNIMTYMENPYMSPLWQKSFGEGFLSNSIRTRGYSLGRGNLRNPLNAHSLIEQDSINVAYQVALVNRFQGIGALGYIISRGSSFDCSLCDSFCNIVWKPSDLILPIHVRCVCRATPIMPDGSGLPSSLELTYVNKEKGGVLFTRKKRISDSRINSNERSKFDKEQGMARVLVDNGYLVEHLGEIPGQAGGDLRVNGIYSELKKLSSHNNIARHAKFAFEEKKVDLLIIEFTKETEKIHSELWKLVQKGYKVKYYFSGRESSIFDL